jgi:hypothetical protein
MLQVVTACIFYCALGEVYTAMSVLTVQDALTSVGVAMSCVLK